LSIAARQIQAEHPGLLDTFAGSRFFPSTASVPFRGMSNFVLPLLMFLALMTAMLAWFS
jgi:hypothetical protein